MLSLIFWAMTLVVTIKYVLLLLRADNKGEGGMFALMALGQTVARRSAPLLGALGIAGASFFYGDAVITPAISVLSAVEGLKLIAPQFERAVIPVAVVVLAILFWMQSRGTDRVARFFGPVMVRLVRRARRSAASPTSPTICTFFCALNPIYGISFVYHHGFLGLTVMGLVFLACTGAEALYADLGTFRPPSDHGVMALLRHARAGSQLLRAGRARHERRRTRSKIRSIASTPISC